MLIHANATEYTARYVEQVSHTVAADSVGGTVLTAQGLTGCPNSSAANSALDDALGDVQMSVRHGIWTFNARAYCVDGCRITASGPASILAHCMAAKKQALCMRLHCPQIAASQPSLCQPLEALKHYTYICKPCWCGEVPGLASLHLTFLSMRAN